jgi:homoserine kinase
MGENLGTGMENRMDIGIEGMEIAVPASIANLGPGFDTLAVAVQLYIRVRVRRVRPDSARELRFDFIDHRLDGENYIERAFRFLARQQDRDFPSLDLEVSSEIPLKSGLGSSAAATVAGLRLYEAVFGRLPAQGLLNAACALEGHPDNAAAAIFGGMTGSCQLQDRSVMAVCFRWPETLQMVVLTPTAPIKKNTAEARGVLPPRIAREDAVFNMQRLVLLFQALQSGQFQFLREALRDRLHQPYREAIVPGLERALNLEHRDLLGVCLSGAGPSIVAFAERNFEKVQRLLARTYDPLGIPYRIRVLQVHQQDAQSSSPAGRPLAMNTGK